MNQRSNTAKFTTSLFLLLITTLLSAQSVEYVGTTSVAADGNTNYYYTKSVTLTTGTVISGTNGDFFITPISTNPPPSPDQNYVRVETPKIEVTSESVLTNMSTDDKAVSYSYTDGVGRATMSSAAEAGQLYEDIVQYNHYDAATGRQDRSYLPYAKAYIESGTYVSNSQTETGNFYNSPPSAVENDGTPYASTEYDERGRIESVIAPGDAWNTSGNLKKTSYEYRIHDPTETNATIDFAVARWEIVNGAPDHDRNYAANELSMTIMTDPQGQKTRQVTDMRGLTITSQVYDPSTQKWHGSYNVYDDFGRVRFVIPPILTAGLSSSNTLVISSTQVEELLFQYEYDIRGRLQREKAPGAGWTEYVYDKWDRLVMSRHEGQVRGCDSNGNHCHEYWSFFKYDALNRLIMTGEVKENRTRATLQAVADGFSVRYEETASTAYGYGINSSFPRLGTDYTSGNYELQTINYFDNYDFLNHHSWDVDIYDQNDFDLSLPSGFSATVAASTIDLPTGSNVLVLGTSKWLSTVMYYDEDYRMLQTVSENHLGGIDRLTYQLDWKGEMQKMMLSHDGNESVTVLSEYEYDNHTEQLLKNFQTINGGTRVEVADYNYNVLGELIEKNLHSTNGSSYLQSVDYRYNIQGSLKSINDADLSGSENDLFGMNYNYTTPSTIGLATGGNKNVEARYDGTVSAMEWNATNNLSNNPFTKSIYGFTYDDRNRLSETSYAQWDGNSWHADKGHFSTNTTFDNNGNIQSLERNAEGAEIDDLTYTYETNSNKLKAVADAATTDGGLDDYYTGATDYAYDAMGNMTHDMNKQIVAISYNHLQLATEIEFGDGTTLAYTYDAVGNRLAKTITDSDNNTIAKVDYVGLVEYLDDEINQIFTNEGRAYKQNGAYHYEYFITDHQGNNRVAFGNLPERNIYLASMEDQNSNDEESQFAFPTSTEKSSQNHTPLGAKSVQLNALDGRALGPAKVLNISANDEVEIEVWAKYTATGWNNSSVGDINTLIHAAFGGASTGTGGESASTSLSNALSAGDPNIYSGNAAGDPEAYFQYLFFDANYAFVPSKSNFKRVGEGTDSNGKFSKLQTDAPVVFNEAGYLFVYLVNESNQNKEVYFDDFKITHSSSTTSFKVSQVNEYYPFGLATANSWRDPGYVDPGLLYQSSFASYDSLTQLSDFFLRNYDPVLGRWLQTDPYNQFASPYVGMGNMPNLGVDPDGGFVFNAAHLLISGLVGGVAVAAHQGANGNAVDDGAKGFAYGFLAGVGLYAGAYGLSQVPWGDIDLAKGLKNLGKGISDFGQKEVGADLIAQHAAEEIIKRKNLQQSQQTNIETPPFDLPNNELPSRRSSIGYENPILSLDRAVRDLSGVPYNYGHWIKGTHSRKYDLNKFGHTCTESDCSGIVSRANFARVKWGTRSGTPPGDWEEITYNVERVGLNQDIDYFLSLVQRGDLFVWSGQHTAWYSPNQSVNGQFRIFHGFGPVGNLSRHSFSLRGYLLRLGAPRIYRQRIANLLR